MPMTNRDEVRLTVADADADLDQKLSDELDAFNFAACGVATCASSP